MALFERVGADLAGPTWSAFANAAKTEPRGLVNSLVPSFAHVNLLLVPDRANVYVSAAIINDGQVCSTTRGAGIGESFRGDAIIHQLRVSPCFLPTSSSLLRGSLRSNEGNPVCNSQ